MRNAIFITAMLLLLGIAVAKGTGRVFRSQTAEKPKHELRIEIDSICCREDLSRVYCRAIGLPNTSDRIDAVSLNGKINATDIDPIDFQRSFQWEEDGVLTLEIDFPALKRKPGNFYLEFQTPYGVVRGAYAAEKK